MIFDNYNNDAGGGRDEIQTPKYNFSGLNSAALLFDVAYQQYDNTHSDTLVVLISTDCGVTFTKLYEKGGSTLSSVNGTLTSNLFTPSSAAQWRTETINLNAYVGQSNVMIVFQNRGHYGQALYIDQINLSSGSGINVLRPEQLGLTVYPNPSDGSFTCSFNGDTQNIYTIELSDMLGQVLHTEKIQGGAFSKVFTLREKGMYMVSINSTDGRFCKKIIVE